MQYNPSMGQSILKCNEWAYFKIVFILFKCIFTFYFPPYTF